MQNVIVHLGSEHLSTGSEHHACRAFFNTEHQGTSTQGVVTGFDITIAENIRNHHVGMQ